MRPPADGVEEGPDVVEFGIAALAAELEDRDVSFPVTTRELGASHGDLAVPVDAAGHEIRLADALERVDEERFDTQGDLLEALHPVFEAERDTMSRSILAQLRGILPL